MIEPFGPNVVTSEGALWRAHVRVTAPPFGEANNHLVWTETFRQLEFLTSSWSKGGSDNLKNDIYLLTLNIIVAAGFGQQLDWTENNKKIPNGHNMSFLASVTGTVTYIVHILLMPKWLLSRSLWKKGYESHVEFEKYMRELIAAETEKVSQDVRYEGGQKGNLLTAVLKASAQEARNNGQEKSRKTYFDDDEVLGNAFMFLLAGRSPSLHCR